LVSSLHVLAWILESAEDNFYEFLIIKH
jgi:hypothetical protein